jgi:predicted O-linked N-acetylglucosamine transferase (SPINDLY family)
MATISEALSIAVQHYQAGRLDAAAEICGRILRTAPDQAGALYLMGVVARQTGQHAAAADYLGRAIAASPRVADYHFNLGLAYRALGRLDDAAACHRRAIEIQPDHFEAHNNLGNVWNNQGRLDDAAACYRRALEIAPGVAEVYANLAGVLAAQEKLDEAADCCRRAVELKPDLADLHYNFGNVRLAQGRFDEAAACYRRALELRPDYAVADMNLGTVLSQQGNTDQATACYRRALELQPDLAGAHNNLGNLLKAQGAFDEALACFHRALQLDPEYAEAHNNLGNLLSEQGRPAAAMVCYQRAIEARPAYGDALGNALLCEQYLPGVTPGRLAEAHARWERQFAAPLRAAWRPHANSRDPDRALRCGFVSADFRHHPVGNFLIRTLEALRAEAAEIVCYSDVLLNDDLTARIARTAHTWREVRTLSHQALAEQIRADRIDILFDLAGHTAGNRLLTFARKPAPLAITWIGYEGTTGLAAMDYLIADELLIPPGDESCYCEKVLRMPGGYVCYDPPRAAAEVGPLPAREPGGVTFASFNNLAKIGPEVIDLWAAILRRVPHARLVLKYRGLDRGSTRDRYAAEFVQRGIEAGRLELQGWSGYREMLALYNRVDIALDPFPFSGSVTTCEALWMGVPVITWPGATFAGRHSLTHLANVGLGETVARDPAHYVELAVELAGDRPRLTALRAGLRGRMAASSLCDGPRFAANLMAVLRGAWRQWVDS